MLILREIAVEKSKRAKPRESTPGRYLGNSKKFPHPRERRERVYSRERRYDNRDRDYFRRDREERDYRIGCYRGRDYRESDHRPYERRERRDNFDSRKKY